MNDADLEMAELAAVGDAAHYARQAGLCPHMSVLRLRCTDVCGKQFASEQAWIAAMDDVISEWL